MKNSNKNNNGPVIENESNNYSWVVLLVIVLGVIAYGQGYFDEAVDYFSSAKTEEKIEIVTVERDLSEILNHENVMVTNVKSDGSDWLFDYEITYPNGSVKTFENVPVSGGVEIVDYIVEIE